MIEKSLCTLLEAESANVYPYKLPREPSYPCIVYERISAKRSKAHSGPPGLAWPLFRLTCIAESYSAVKELSDGVRAALDGYSDTDIHSAFVEGDSDMWEFQPEKWTVAMLLRLSCTE